MRHLRLGLVLFALLSTTREAFALLPGHFKNLERINSKLHGQVLDFTSNHGRDNRIWSQFLGQKRDLYVYLPPGFDPGKKYPFAIFLHGAALDEQMFLTFVVQEFDRAISNGVIPPFIIAAPDGSIQGRPSFLKSASWFANTMAGDFEEFIVQDVYNFMMDNFPIMPEREAHALIGVSMGGAGAVALGIKHRDKFKIIMGFMPAVNLRWVDCHGRYHAKFDPDCWGWRTSYRPWEVIGRKLPVPVTFNVLFYPTLGKGPDAIARLSQYNPIELMEAYNLQDGDLSIYLAYGGRDEFNITAQVQSFLHLAECRGIHVGVGFDPKGRHDLKSGRRLIPDALAWAAPLIPDVSAQQAPLPGSILGVPFPSPPPSIFTETLPGFPAWYDKLRQR